MKPTHHIDDATLLSYSAGALPAALVVVASAHLERCPECRDRLLDADQIGGALMQQQRVDTPPAEDARAAMLALLDVEPEVEHAALPIEIVEERDPDRLPSALHPWFGKSMRALRWRRVAPGVQRILASGPRGTAELYVALTRATQRLGVLHREPLPKALAGLAEHAVARAAVPAAELLIACHDRK